MNLKGKKVWTIGHSRHEIDSFIKLLKDNSIEVRKRAKRMEERLDAVKKIFEA